MRTLALMFAVFALSVGSSAAHANPIVFTESATASGYDGFSFYTNQTVTIKAYGDTSKITSTAVNLGNGMTGYIYDLNVSLATIEVGTGPVFTFSDALQVFDNQFGAVAGLTDLTEGDDILDTSANAFATYALASNGTAKGSTTYHAGKSYTTSNGNFFVNSTTGNATFTALVTPAAVTAATPEPSSLVLLGSGLFGVAGFARRKFCGHSLRM